MQAERRKKRISSRAVSSLLLIGSLTAVIFISGCGSKKYEDKIAELQGTNQLQAEEIQELYAQLDSGSVTSAESQSSLVSLDSGEKEFITDEGVLTFPKVLGLDAIGDDVNNSSIKIGSKFSIQPTGSWRFSLKGTTLEVYHPSGINGKIKAFTLDDRPDEDTVRSKIESFYTGFPKTTIHWSSTSMSDRFSGYLSYATTKVDKKNALINAGIVFRSEFGLNAIFLAKENKDTDPAIQQELIDSLLATLSYSDERLKID